MPDLTHESFCLLFPPCTVGIFLFLPFATCHFFEHSLNSSLPFLRSLPAVIWLFDWRCPFFRQLSLSVSPYVCVCFGPGGVARLYSALFLLLYSSNCALQRPIALSCSSALWQSLQKSTIAHADRVEPSKLLFSFCCWPEKESSTSGETRLDLWNIFLLLFCRPRHWSIFVSLVASVARRSWSSSRSQQTKCSN